MTHTSTEQPELLPCPFCGAKAHFDIDDENWEWIECEGCGMQGNRSASLMEDCKPKLREEWNRRTPASQAQRVPLGTMQIIEEIRKSGFKKTISDNHLNIFRLAERAHGITQEKQG